MPPATTAQPRSPHPLAADFFSAAESAHRSLAPALRGRARLAGGGQRAARPRTRSSPRPSSCSATVAPLEAFFAYPGPRLIGAIEQALAERNAGVCARLVQHVSAALLTGAYRHDAAAWDPLQEDAAPCRPTCCRRTCRPATATSRTSRALVVTPSRPVAVGARAARPEAAAAARRRVRLRGRPGRDLRGRGHRHDLQSQPAGGGHPGRVRVPLTPRRAGAARVPAAAPARRRGKHRAGRAGDGAGARHQALSARARRLPADRSRGRGAGRAATKPRRCGASSTTSRS